MDRQKERDEAVKKARALLKQRPVYLDSETTGLEHGDVIVDLSIVDFDGKVLFNSLVQPQISIPSGATRVHGITNSMVANAPTWTALWPEIGAILAGRVTAIYNAEFDTRLMKQTTEKNRISWNSPSQATICIMELYARYFGEWNEYRQSFTWQSLEKAARQCKIDLPNTHRAKEDAILARAVLYFMAGEDYSQKTVPESNAIVSMIAPKTPEEKELESKNNRLKELEESLADKELELATIHAELAAFERLYLGIVGIKLAELDRVEAAIAEFLAASNPGEPVYQQKAAEARQAAEESSYANHFSSEPGQAEKFTPSEKLKNLFRETARKIHPDFAANDQERLVREELMKRANRAYRDGNEEELLAILNEWESHPERIDGDGIGNELIRVIRKIDALENLLADLGNRLNDVKNSDLYILMGKVDAAKESGRDLLGEMAAQIEESISQKKLELEDIEKKGSASDG